LNACTAGCLTCGPCVEARWITTRVVFAPQPALHQNSTDHKAGRTYPASGRDRTASGFALL
jgi:hypothetical protein